MTYDPASAPDIADHLDAVDPDARFGVVRHDGVVWDLSHLDPFALHVEVDGVRLTVVVFFSCHCFTSQPGDEDHKDYYHNGREVRVLSRERYELSRRFLPQVIRELDARHIQVTGRGNFFTLEVEDIGCQKSQYGVFFELRRDKKRGKRLILRVQSAYPIAALTDRQRKAGKVRFRTLVKAAYEDRTIRG